jgi:uncharacterized protein YjbK
MYSRRTKNKIFYRGASPKQRSLVFNNSVQFFLSLNTIICSCTVLCWLNLTEIFKHVKKRGIRVADLKNIGTLKTIRLSQITNHLIKFECFFF